jgi:RNA polymerase sigma-70 factor (ECF subfamily)
VGVDDGGMSLDRGQAADAALLERVADGDLDALGDLYVRHGPLVRAALARFAADIAAAELDELTQEVFLELARVAGTFRRESRVTTWLYGIAIRKARSHRRTRWVRRRIRAQHADDCSGVAMGRDQRSPERAVIERQAALEALTLLPVAQREVVWLHAVEDMNAREIAQILHISERTVWTRLHRARKRLAGVKTAASNRDEGEA